MTYPLVKTRAPQSFISSYAPRIRTYGNALLAPVIQPAAQVPPLRTTKRGTTAINYAEDGFDDDDLYDSEGPRPPTGLRSLRREELVADKSGLASNLGKELSSPVELQGIWREWMGKQAKTITERQQQVQTTLPLTLIPIRIDLDVSSFRPEPPLPAPTNARDFGIDENLPAYRQPELTPAYRLKDSFLWNLHEALATPDQFARKFVEELDFPQERKQALVMQITNQIRQQLEDYAGVALHPLFHVAHSVPLPGHRTSDAVNALSSQVQTPPHDASTQTSNANNPARERDGGQAAFAPSVSASAQQLSLPTTDDSMNPDDAYRCIVNLNVNLLNKLYSDRFEWSLLHPPGFAEQFAKQTCADLGLASEWITAIAHAIYEAVLRLKKEVCENGGLLINYGEFFNDAARGEAGWRYDPEHLGDEWEPKVEVLSKEEIEKREGDRERQLRRVRRETARYSSTATMSTTQPQPDYFATQDREEPPMGRGERSKKKRRFRSLSPLGRDTPDTGVAGYGGGVALRDDERQYWRCSHCAVWGSAVWAVRDGPNGPRSLCHNCGFLFERDKKLPPWSKEFYAHDNTYGGSRR